MTGRNQMGTNAFQGLPPHKNHLEGHLPELKSPFDFEPTDLAAKLPQDDFLLHQYWPTARVMHSKCNFKPSFL